MTNLQQKLEGLQTATTLMKEDIRIAKSNIVQLQQENLNLRRDKESLLDEHHRQMQVHTGTGTHMYTVVQVYTGTDTHWCRYMHVHSGTGIHRYRYTQVQVHTGTCMYIVVQVYTGTDTCWFIQVQVHAGTCPPCVCCNHRHFLMSHIDTDSLARTAHNVGHFLEQCGITLVTNITATTCSG